MKWNTLAGGALNVTSVNPVSKAGVPVSRPKTWTRSGTDVSLSSAIRIDVTSERGSFGLRDSWYDGRPATRAVSSTVIEVVGVIAASARAAATAGVGSCEVTLSCADVPASEGSAILVASL